MADLQKTLAQFGARSEARRAMKGQTSRPIAVVAVIASAAFLWILVLSVSPQLHESIHTDANQGEHTCAVTFISSGSYDLVGTSLAISSPLGAIQFSKVPALTPCWVPSPFLGASVFEHAPPANS